MRYFIKEYGIPDYRRRELDSLQDAIEYVLTPKPYSYEGELERMRRETELLREMLKRLISRSSINSQVENVKAILGIQIDVEE